MHKLIRQRREAALKQHAKDGVPVRVVSQAVIDVLDATEVFGRRVVELSDAMDSSYPGTFPRERAAVKRASMELTRALAVMRRNELTEYPKRED